MIAEDGFERKARENLEQLQGSLNSSSQGNLKIIKDLEDQRICREHASRKIQCGAFKWYAAGPHPGAGKSSNGNTSLQNLGCAVDEDDIRALERSHYPNRETHDSAVQEQPSEKSGHRFDPADHDHQAPSNPSPSDQKLSQDRNIDSRSKQKFDPNRTCSLNGYKVEESQTSATCRLPGNDHNKLTTHMDIKGGNIRNKEWSNAGLPSEERD